MISIHMFISISQCITLDIHTSVSQGFTINQKLPRVYRPTLQTYFRWASMKLDIVLSSSFPKELSSICFSGEPDLTFWLVVTYSVSVLEL